jgi:starvation-inducible DNA-binding protein
MVRRGVSIAANFRVLTGRFIVSKARSDKVFPDLDTPTDLPAEAVEKISAAVNPSPTLSRFA